MNEKYNVYLISTYGETLDSSLLSRQSQFKNFKYKKEFFSKDRTNVDKIIKELVKEKILLYSTQLLN